jgi:hypothetical protein
MLLERDGLREVTTYLGLTIDVIFTNISPVFPPKSQHSVPHNIIKGAVVFKRGRGYQKGKPTPPSHASHRENPAFF